MTETSHRKRHIGARYLALGLIFLTICIAYVAVLLVYQLRGTTLPPREEGYIRTYTVPGVRGEIYDCNGVLLVGNSTSYDLIYEYGAMPDTRREINNALLQTMEAVLSTGNGDRLAGDYFILEGMYPKLHFSSALRDHESQSYRFYQKFLERQELPSDADASTVVKYFIKSWSR